MGDLFNKKDFSGWLQNIREEIKNKIDDMSEEDFHQVNIEEMKEEFKNYVQIDIPEILEGKITMDEPLEIDMPLDYGPLRPTRPSTTKGFLFTFRIPFNGDGKLFSYQPSSRYVTPPRGMVESNAILIEYRQTANEPVESMVESVSREFKHEVKKIMSTLRDLKSDYLNHLKTIEFVVKDSYKNRAARLEKKEKIVQNLKYPLTRRENAPKTYKLPTIRRTPTFRKAPSPTKPKQESEWVLDDDEYNKIIEIIQNMAIVMEQSPNAFKHLKEPDLRWHFLVQLNGQYKGRATGETFNYQGDTDIRINVEGKNIFIAECKFWNGPKSILKAINQLLSYLSWRDIKTAIIIFNKRKNFTSVIEQIPQTVRKHECCDDYLGKVSDTIFKFQFHQKEDQNRKLICTFMAFDIKIPEKGGQTIN